MKVATHVKVDRSPSAKGRSRRHPLFFLTKKLAATGRKRISMPRPRAGVDGDACKNSASSKGHFIIYTTDGRRSAVPLAYHNTPIFQQLFRMSEDEFGLPRDGPITMLFDAIFMDYIVSLLQRAVPEDLERALLFSLPTTSLDFIKKLQPFLA
ncbi:hypothetical protein ACLOJK_017703 [Asimina triloba]